MKGKTVLITGANSGIGKATAIALARFGAEIIIISRNAGNGAQTISEIKKLTGSELIHFFQCDLSSMDQIRRVSEEIHNRFNKLDVLINNAGVLERYRKITQDSFEYLFGVNYLSHFLLTQLLIDLIRNSNHGRIINLTSGAHRFGKIHFDDIHLEGKHNGFKAYAQSKLANVIFTYALCSRLHEEGITANSVHPGFVGTKIVFLRDSQSTPWPFKIYQRIAKKPIAGAKTVIYLASSAEMENKSGRYYVNKRSIPSSKSSYDPDAATALWNMSLRMCDLKNSLI